LGVLGAVVWELIESSAEHRKDLRPGQYPYDPWKILNLDNWKRGGERVYFAILGCYIAMFLGIVVLVALSALGN
jgi:hypothetical protein